MKFPNVLITSSSILALTSFALFAGPKTSADSVRPCVKNATSIDCPHLVGKAGCASKDTSCVKKTETKATKAPPKQIMFFLNPNGRPCQMQLAVFNAIKDTLAGLATIKYVKTTVEADRDSFYKWGIRGLPALIILDSEGKEIKRFTPGIQDENAILSALKSPNK